MWIASKNGFISVVAHWDLADVLIVRARVKHDLQSLFDSQRIIETEDADYRFRVLVNKQEMANILVKMIKGIDYPNFKNEIAVHPDQNDKLKAYHEIWKVMRDYANHSIFRRNA
ncbi:hypothetical protein [Pararhodonellum marinum]|uniref:hypothetical protein n=1 Tax=Pararhodonellum marinum TaxID=2755358 RepID=UPI00188F31ED|nr:hypothetical protein [Pararhodonellum marinum]